MKKTLVIYVIFFAAYNCLAQQKPHYTQYILNQYIINPALSGIENYTDIKISHRHQWSGFNGAPVTTYLSVQGPLGKNDYRTTATSFDVPGVNPKGERYWETYTAAEPHHGIGLQVINDVTGPLRNTSIYGTYAYHLGLSARTSLAAGVGIGFNRFGLDASKLDFGAVSVDPVVASSDVLNTTHLDATAGLYLYSADYFAGVSVQQVVPLELNFSDNRVTGAHKGRTVPHLFATVGQRFLLSEDFNLTPSLRAKYIQPVPVQLEANIKLQYRNSFWLDAGYRHKDGFSGMLGFMVSNTFNIGYANDHTTSMMNNYSKGSHELLLGFVIGNKNIW